MNTKENRTSISGCGHGYETPVSKAVKFTSEGVLCTSLTGTTVENYQEQEFEW
jgi:hypothetical protein